MEFVIRLGPILEKNNVLIWCRACLAVLMDSTHKPEANRCDMYLHLQLIFANFFEYAEFITVEISHQATKRIEAKNLTRERWAHANSNQHRLVEQIQHSSAY